MPCWRGSRTTTESRRGPKELAKSNRSRISSDNRREERHVFAARSIPRARTASVRSRPARLDNKHPRQFMYFLSHRTTSAAPSVQNGACSATCRRYIYSSGLESRAETKRHGPSVRVRHIAVNAIVAAHCAAEERWITVEHVLDVQEQPGVSNLAEI